VLDPVEVAVDVADVVAVVLALAVRTVTAVDDGEVVTEVVAVDV